MNKKSLALLFCFSSLSLFAAQWTGGTNNAWTNNGNWTNPATFPNGASAVANFTANPTPANNLPALGGPITLGTLTFDTANGYTIVAGGTLTFSAATTAEIIVTNTNGNGTIAINPNTPLSSNLTIDHRSSGTLTMDGVMSGPHKLTKTGSGLLVFNGGAANTYTLGTEIIAGTLEANNANKLGSGSITIENGILRFTAPTSPAVSIVLTGAAGIQATPFTIVTMGSGIISGNGSLQTGGPGTIILNGTNTYKGGTTISDGITRISSNANLGDSSGTLNFGGGTLDITSSPLTIPRSGTVTAPSTIYSGGTITFQGNFSGAGSLTFTNGGTFVLVGNNSYTGGSIVNGNTHLAGTTNGIQGPITLSAATSKVTFSQNFDGTYSGAITGPGQVFKVGSGTVTFTGNSAGFTGPTQVQYGPLIVNGSLINSSLVTVLAGATLGGTGSVGPVTSSGTINPGPSIGTLNINGALMMNAGSNVIIDIAPNGVDRIAVNGAATFVGPIPLSINPANGFYGFSLDGTILTSTGLVGAPIPGFNPVTSNISFFVPSITYTLTDVLLHVDILQPFGLFQFSNQNTAAVGKNIDALFAAGELSVDLFNIIDSLAGQSEVVINDALDQMHPATYSAYIDQQAEVMGQLIHRFHRQPYLPCACSNPNRFWVQPFGDSLTVKRHGIQIGFQGNSGGLALGYDGEIASNWTFGFGTAWNTTHLDLHDHRGRGSVNGLYGAAYTDYQWGGFYFGAALLSGVDFYDTTRDIKFVNLHRKADASFRSVDVAGQITSAYLFGAPQAFFYPYFNLDYLYVSTGSYQEEGAGGLSLKVNSRGDGILRTETGLALQVIDTNAAETMCISPEISLGFVNMTSIQRPMYKSFFQDAPIAFKTRGWEKTWNLLHVDFGLSFAYRCFGLGLQYNVELSPDSQTLFYNQHGNIRLDWKW